MPSATDARDALVGAILSFLNGADLLAIDAVRIELEREIDDAGVDAVLALKARLAEEHGWDFYARDDLARRIHHLLAGRFLAPDSTIDGLAHLDAIASSPLVIVANHLSYADANVVEVLLHRAGATSPAGRLTAVAGPKVFTSRERRFSSLCFGTIKVPQSADVASEEAVLNPREVARAARRAIDVAHHRLAAGDALLLFPEGTRSRAAAMQPMLSAVARYLEFPNACVVPAALTGSESLFSIGGSLRPARVTVRFGTPLPTAALFRQCDGDRRAVMDTVGRAIAAQLPAAYRGVYATGDRA